MPRSFLIAFVLLCSTSQAGLRIDLRPTPPVPPQGYQPNSIVNVEAFLVDTGNPQGAISFRGVFMDFTDTAVTLSFPGEDGMSNTFDDNYFSWVMPSCGAVGCGSHLPQVSWVYPLTTPIPLFQITMPDNGEVLLGDIDVNVGQFGGVLDVMNDDNADPNFGARVDFGFGGAGDPVTTWRAFTGEITGGVLELPVVPEPGTALLLVSGCFALACRRSRART